MKNLQFLPLLSLFLILCFAACQNTSQSDESVTETPSKDSVLSDDSLLTLVQQQTFQYFWEGAEPNSGLARERIHMDNVYPQNDQNVVTTGGSGFGIMAILVGIERGFITRQEGADRFKKIVDFLEKADRFHGAWPHWMEGESGKVKPFSPNDDGGDLVETAFLVQGLLCARQYFQDGNENEKALASRMDALWKGVEWDWYRNGGKNVLYWHWSPTKAWVMNFPLEGYNECLITYVLAASSPTHGIPAEVYHEGWARSGSIKADVNAYGQHLSLKHNGAEQYGGPLFWAHYSYLGLNPTDLVDDYANYWEENKNQSLINYKYCVDNPEGYKGYGPNCWGLTASYSVDGYAGHSPSQDLGVITPTAALSSFPYTPDQSMAALKHFYNDLKGQIWGPYGFYDAFSVDKNWYPVHYLAIDQGPIVGMIENYRTGFLWDLFMSCPEVKDGLKKLDFKSPNI